MQTTQPEAIEQYSIRVADAWKLGRGKARAEQATGDKNAAPVDDGVLLLVAKQDRKLRIEAFVAGTILSSSVGRLLGAGAGGLGAGFFGAAAVGSVALAVGAGLLIFVLVLLMAPSTSGLRRVGRNTYRDGPMILPGGWGGGRGGGSGGGGFGGGGGGFGGGGLPVAGEQSRSTAYKLKRLWRHRWASTRQLLAVFDEAAFRRVESAIAEGENLHRGEIRFAVEAVGRPCRRNHCRPWRRPDLARCPMAGNLLDNDRGLPRWPACGWGRGRHPRDQRGAAGDVARGT